MTCLAPSRLGSRRPVSTFSRTRFAQGFAKSRVIGIGADALRSGPSKRRDQSLGRDCPRNGDCPLEPVALRMTFFRDSPLRGQSLAKAGPGTVLG